MPDITGFDLVKQIPSSTSISFSSHHHVTAEPTLTNNWKARWSGCQFLNKPLTPQDVPEI